MQFCLGYEYARKAWAGCCPRPGHHVTVVADSGVVTVATISSVFHRSTDALCFPIAGLSRPLTEDPLIVRPCIVMISLSPPPFSLLHVTFVTLLVAGTITTITLLRCYVRRVSCEPSARLLFFSLGDDTITRCEIRRI